jgi:hypothetical protein
MTELTVLEVHLHDASFTANAPNSGAGSTDDEAETVAADADRSGRLAKFLAVAVVVFLVVLGGRFVSGADEPVHL